MATRTHLARRGATYVWRRTLPTTLGGPRGDFRLSTRSHLLAEAARRARRLDVAFDAVVEALESMRSDGLTLSLEEVNAIVRAALQRALDETEAARALAGPRSAADAHAAVEAHQQRHAALRRALACNDLDALPALWPAAAPLLAGRTPADAALLGRALLRALERACLIEAGREGGAYDDDASGWLPHPSCAPGAPPAAVPAHAAPVAPPPLLRPPTPPAPFTPLPAPVVTAAWMPLLAAGLPAFGVATTTASPASPPALATPRPEAVRAPAAPSTPAPTAGPAVPAGTPADPDGPRISQLLDGFLVRLTGEVQADTVVDYRQSLGLFIALMGDRPVASVSLDDVLAFRTELRRLPAKYAQCRDFKGKPLRDTVAIADALDRTAEPRVDEQIARGAVPAANRMHAITAALVPRLSMKAANKHLTALRSFFDYARDARHRTGDNPVANAFFAKSLTGKRARNERAPWEPEAVRAVLLSPAWTGCASESRRAEAGPLIVKDDFYWTWLVLTHHPLRLEEACQLMTRDVVQMNGLWCLRIAEDEGANQQLKTENAERFVPIHRLLLKAGFLDHVARQRRDGVLALFPSFQPATASRSKQLTETVSVKVRQRFGRKFYKKISAYLLALDQHQPGRVNHSLRHTIDTMLHNLDIASVRIAELLGHQRMSGGETTNRYFKGSTLVKLKEAIDAIGYGVDVETDGRLVARPELGESGTVVPLTRRR